MRPDLTGGLMRAVRRPADRSRTFAPPSLTLDVHRPSIPKPA